MKEVESTSLDITHHQTNPPISHCLCHLHIRQFHCVLVTPLDGSLGQHYVPIIHTHCPTWANKCWRTKRKMEIYLENWPCPTGLSLEMHANSGLFPFVSDCA
uniref:Uncharacterized protein n=1 Tax=Physcomitrium patens TaxID=3218 RepID=A0A2K1IM15_PHYPA|nr:hypothetical protein PHYPA_026629 [Physcomitrium patens]